MAKKRIPYLLLIIALVIVIIGSVFAQMFNTSLYSSKVSRISFDVEGKGTLSGLLYMPKGASATDPRPTVVVTHGYLNSGEMQDANAIELSRRGYVVLALDMYDHGHSAGDAANTGGFLNFWPTAIYDAAKYMYEQPYVLKDEAGNGIIGVTGHSMGGFSSSMALFQDETAFATNGYRVIYCGLSEGSDYSYTAWLGVTIDAAVGMLGGRTVGKVAAQFDEFFFNPENAPGTVVKKDYVATAEGKKFLEQEAPAANTWYDTADGGRRIIYQPYETHPWNHFSTKTTAYAVEFYDTAFAQFNTGLKKLAPGNQIWLLKELFELVALVGLCLLVVPVVTLLQKAPFFKLAKTAAVPTLPAAQGLSSKLGIGTLLACCILLPGIIFPALMDKNLTSEPLMYLCDAGAIFGVVGIIAIICGLRNKDEGKKYAVAGGVLVLAGAAMVYLTTASTFATNKTWQAPTVNQIVYWTLICAVIAAIIMALVFIVTKSKQGARLAHYGVKASPVAVLASLATAVVTVGVVYAIVFLVDAVFKTDFRIWVFAFKTFEAPIIPAALKYMPFFFIYYFIGTVAICINTNSEKVQTGKGKGYLLAILLNAGGITVYLLRQYITLFATGTAAHPTQALSSILLFAMVPTLIIAACYSRALYKRTGNVWTPAFFNAILMTLMTVANTCVYFQR